MKYSPVLIVYVSVSPLRRRSGSSPSSPIHPFRILFHSPLRFSVSSAIIYWAFHCASSRRVTVMVSLPSILSIFFESRIFSPIWYVLVVAVVISGRTFTFCPLGSKIVDGITRCLYCFDSQGEAGDPLVARWWMQYILILHEVNIMTTYYLDFLLFPSVFPYNP